MNVRIIAFTDRGQALAERLGTELDAPVMRCGRPLSLDGWTMAAFAEAEGLVFVGAVGIAVRAVAPYLKSKAADPAVVAVDETGQYAIPLLSGHLGGANDLARHVAALCGAAPVITTATDRRGVFAVDEWARRQGCAVLDPERIKDVSARLLAGETISVGSDWPVAGTPPEGVQTVEGADCDVLLTLRPTGRNVLRIVPRIAVLGVGCKRGTTREAIERAFQAVCRRGNLCPAAAVLVCSIDRKAREPGLLEFCQAHGLPLQVYTAEELRQVRGTFTGSDFVEKITGVDNVCERSAVKGSGGELYWSKDAGDGVAMAVALRPFAPDWRWQYG